MKTQELTKFEVHSNIVMKQLRYSLSGIAFFQNKNGKNYIKVNRQYVDNLIERKLISEVH